MTDFFETEAGQFASLAKQFLEGALTLDAAQKEKGRILFRPTLALAGHGLELMLKACLCINGLPLTKGRDGHNIGKLWSNEVCEPLRGHMYDNARIVAEVDRLKGDYPDVPKDEDVLALIQEYLLELGKLHGGGAYPLRYPANPNQTAPRTPFLVKSLRRTADDLVKRPNHFELQRFRSMN